MPLSMTGFSRLTETGEDLTLSLQIKSVNSRYFDLTIHAPDSLAFLEQAWQKQVRREISRGKIDLRVDLVSDREDAVRILTDKAKARAYAEAYRELAALLGEDPPPLTSLIAQKKGIFLEEEGLDQDASLASWIAACLDRLLAQFHSMREREGDNLKGDLLARLDRLEDSRRQVEKTAALVPEAYRRRLEERVQDLLQDRTEEFYDGQRIAAEVALFADKADIQEELVRLKSHFQQARLLLEGQDIVGKKLDFLIQEMNREANTIASKAQDLTMTKAAVDLKTGIEQVREQVQNLE